MGAGGEFVIATRHFHLRASGQIVQRQVDRAAPVMPRSPARIGDIITFRPGRRRIPQRFGNAPWAIGIVDGETKALLLCCLVRTDQCFGSGSHKEGAGLVIELPTGEVVRAGIADVEADAGVEVGQFDKAAGVFLNQFPAAVCRLWLIARCLSAAREKRRNKDRCCCLSAA